MTQRTVAIVFLALQGVVILTGAWLGFVADPDAVDPEHRARVAHLFTSLAAVSIVCEAWAGDKIANTTADHYWWERAVTLPYVVGTLFLVAGPIIGMVTGERGIRLDHGLAFGANAIGSALIIWAVGAGLYTAWTERR